MDDNRLEVRDSLRRAAAASSAGLTLPEVTTIDAYEREAQAVVQTGISRDDLIARVERVMGLQLTYEEGGETLAVFPVTHSTKYRALQVLLERGRCAGKYNLVALDSSVGNA